MNTGDVHVDIAAEVLEELHLALREGETRFKRQRAAQGPVEAGQDLLLALPHIPAVLQLQQVQVQLGARLKRVTGRTSKERWYTLHSTRFHES